MLQNSGQAVSHSINIAAKTNGTSNGTGVDLANRQWAVIMFQVGTVTDGTHTPKVQESDDNSTYTDVAAADQIGTLAALASNTPQIVQYKGGKRYIRPVITTTGATTGAVAGAAVMRGPSNEG